MLFIKYAMNKVIASRENKAASAVKVNDAPAKDADETKGGEA